MTGLKKTQNKPKTNNELTEIGWMMNRDAEHIWMKM